MNFAGVWKVPCVHRLPEQPLVDQRPDREADRVADVRGQGARLRRARRAGRRQRRARRARARCRRRARARALRRRPDVHRGASPTASAPHSTSDDPTRYRSQAEVDAWGAKDPLRPPAPAPRAPRRSCRDAGDAALESRADRRDCGRRSTRWRPCRRPSARVARRGRVRRAAVAPARAARELEKNRRRRLRHV